MFLKLVRDVQEAAKAVICVTTGLLRHNELASLVVALVFVMHLLGFMYSRMKQRFIGVAHMFCCRICFLSFVFCVCFIDMLISRVCRRVFPITVFPFYISNLNQGTLSYCLRSTSLSNKTLKTLKGVCK